jgi:hypothetical protein
MPLKACLLRPPACDWPAIAARCFRSLADLQAAAINRYLGEHNPTPKPFV